MDRDADPMAPHRTHGGDRCARCGWPLHDPYEIVSRHPVAEGSIVYARCACGTLRAWLARRSGGERLVVGARHTVRGDGGPAGGPDGRAG
ncbi:hypothetical protein [Streptomyces spirodelae]|uniref:RNHCP domain-containing protein n=1 Tax=Streptomyces spirodelae TaxID=2812904 RepID=A0ABS3WSA8_9ACTN|nr:hypothetical protein [Streptomyces spirodelae]MBO8186016.1 hypothetical protein [Streptomyces spirodelae]